MMKKYELLESDTREVCGKKLYRIRALKDFGCVKTGELGGYIEKEDNLSHLGSAWIGGNAWIVGNARIKGNAVVAGDARIEGNARIEGDAMVGDNNDIATISGFGRNYRTTTFYRLKSGEVGVTCGCFTGTLNEFREKVKETHGESKKGKEYLMIADLMEYRFSE